MARAATQPTEIAEPAATTAALEVRNLEAAYHRQTNVLRGVSLTVPDGAVVALLGPNGAGKTTTLRAISGLLDIHDGQIRKGTVLLDGRDITATHPAARVRHGLAQVLEGRQLFAALTVEENLRVGAHTRGRDQTVPADLDDIYQRFPPLAERRSQRAGLLSGGEQQMLAIGRALMARPQLLLLDEPSLGLAPRLIETIRDTVAAINTDGTSILLVEQNATMALSIADHGYVLEQGRIVLDGTTGALLANDDIRDFYLGRHGDTTPDYLAVKHYRRRKRWLS